MITIVLITQVVLEILILTLIYVFMLFVGYFIWGKLKIYYRSWQIKKLDKKWQKEREEYVQRKCKLRIEQELRRKEREKYPLFFWRELCSESVNEHMKQKKENI